MNKRLMFYRDVVLLGTDGWNESILEGNFYPAVPRT